MKRRTRRTLYSVAGVVVVLVLLIALAPTLINMGLFHGTIRNAIEANINGRVEFAQLRLSWTGPQRVHGFRIIDEQGIEAVNVDLEASPSLFALIFGAQGSVDATAAGTLRGELYPDGRTSFQRLLVERPPPEVEPDEPFDLSGVPPITFRLLGLTAFMRDVVTDETYTYDLNGELVYVPGDRLTFDVDGAEHPPGDGAITLTGRTTGLFDSNGRFTPQNAPMNVVLAAYSLPVPSMADVRGDIQNFELSVQSENMAELIAIQLEANAQLENQPPSRFQGQFRVRMPFRPDGTLDVSMDNIEGELAGERVPSSLLQPFLGELPIVLSRDVGPSVDIDVRMDTAADAVTHVRVTGALAELDLSARMDNGWWVGDRLVIRTATAHPALVEGFTGLATEQPTDFELTLTSFGFPPVDEATDSRPIHLSTLVGTMRVSGPVVVVMNGEESVQDVEPDDEPAEAQPIRVTLADAIIEFETAPEGIGQHLDLRGSMSMDGAAVNLNQRVFNLYDEVGELQALQANPVGELTLAGLPLHTVAQWMPEQEELLRDALGDSLDAEVRTQLVEAGLEAQLTATTPNAHANLSARRGADALHVQGGNVTFTPTPALVNRFVREADNPIRLISASPAEAQIDPFTVPGAAPADWQFTDIPITGRVNATRAVLENIPGTAERVSVRDLAANFAVQLGEAGSYSLQGEVTLRRPAENRDFALARYNVSAAMLDEALNINGDIELDQIVVLDLEAVTGHEPGEFAQWIGDTGRVAATFSGGQQQYQARLTAHTPRLEGVFDAETNGEVVAVRSERATLTLTAAALEQMLAPEDDPGMLRVMGDLPVTLVLNSRLPFGLFPPQKPFDPFMLAFDARLSGGPLIIQDEEGRHRFDRINLSMRAVPTSEHIDIIGTFDIPESARRNAVGGGRAEWALREALRPGQPFDWRDGRLNADASFQRTPTALIDTFLGMGGYLTSTVGATMDATITADGFSRDSGTLSAQINTPNGWLRAAAQGREGALMVLTDQPVEAELEITPLLRQRVLPTLNPFFVDIMASERPLRATLSNATLPMDGDVTRLSGDVIVDIGPVQFDRGSGLFAALAIPGIGAQQRVAGSIEPIHASIRQGIVSYDRFLVNIGDVSVPMQGNINLVTRAVQLRSTMPLGYLIAAAGVDLGGAAGVIQVPLVTRGELGQPLSLEIDPQFDLAGAMLEAGVRRGLEEVIPGIPRRLEDLIPRPRPRPNDDRR